MLFQYWSWFSFNSKIQCSSTFEGYFTYFSLGPDIYYPLGVMGIVFFSEAVCHFSVNWYLSCNLTIQIICTVKKHIMTGGPKRLPYTVPPLIFSALRVCLLLFQNWWIFLSFTVFLLTDTIRAICTAFYQSTRWYALFLLYE